MTDLQLVLLLVACWRLALPVTDTAPWGGSSGRQSSALPLDCSESLSLGQSLATFHENLSMGSCKESKEGMQKPSGNLEPTCDSGKGVFCQSNILVKSETSVFIQNIKYPSSKTIHVTPSSPTEHIFIFL